VHPTSVRLGLLGCGTVGSAFIRLVQEQRAYIEARTGLRLEVTRVAVRDANRDRGVDLPPSVFTSEATEVVRSGDIDVVVEVMGGIEPARSLVLDAIEVGKPVVTANKELLANVGAEVFDAAADAGVDLLFEAAVAGGIPLVRPLRESLLGEPIRRVMGIVNGTTNYILTRMTEEGVSYPDALVEAKALGYAEADPTADVEGYDAGAKCAILASIAFGARVTASDVYHEGITAITATDIGYATRTGRVVKLLAIAEREPTEPAGGVGVGVRVHPVLLPSTHPLASVRESFNAVFVEGAAAGDLMFYGRGAGGEPTASAVLGDVVDAAVNHTRGTHASIGTLGEANIRSIEDLVSEYYLRLEVMDRPGVLGSVASIFGSHEVSISSMEQYGRGDDATLLFITHEAREHDIRTTMRELNELETVHRVGSMIRAIGGDP